MNEKEEEREPRRNNGEESALAGESYDHGKSKSEFIKVMGDFTLGSLLLI